MSQHGTIRRYSLIVEKARTRSYPSLKELGEYLFTHGFEHSERTLQRDIEQLRNEFGIEITYSYVRRGYFIDEANSVHTDSFLRFLSIVNTAHLFTESLQESKKILNYIDFENQGSLKGLEYLRPLLFAINNCRQVALLYKKFQSSSKKNYVLWPYMLKEYQSRWYVLGMTDQKDFLVTFGVDRICELKVMTETFRPRADIHPDKLFAHTIGVTHSISKVEQVILSFTPHQGHYIKTLPLHASQKVLIDNEQELRISLQIVINYECIQRILIQGDTVRVLSPQSLVEKIKTNLENTLKKYN